MQDSAPPTSTTAAPLDVTGRPTSLREVDLDRFFHPRTVAIIGASDTPGKQATLMTNKLLEWSATRGARLLPVNPRRDEVAGMRCYASVTDIDEPIDLAAILHPDALGGFQELAEIGVKFAVVFAAGFAETGADGRRQQEQLAGLVAASSTHLLGPNTNLNAFELFDDGPERKLALITQSGHQGRPLYQARDLGLKMSAWAPTGNEVDLEFADFVGYFIEQSDTAVIGAYIEGFHDGRTLALAADAAAQRGIPIVCVKVGRTAEGASMAMSHTGHLAGSDDVVDAVFRQYGVIRVDGLDELQDVSMMFTRAGEPSAPGVGIYAISGGTGAHMADLCSAAGLSVPTLSSETQEALHQWIPEFLRVSNPIDSGGPPSMDERGPKIIAAALADPAVGVLVASITGSVPVMGLALARDLAAAAETSTKPICVVWGAPTTDDPAYDVLVASKVVLFRTFRNCVTAVGAWLDYHSFVRGYRSPFPGSPRRRSAAAKAADQIIDGAHGVLSEQHSKELLSAYGIRVTRDIRCRSAAEALRAAGDLGYPVVAKIASPDIAHKSDLGLVRVGVSSPGELRTVYRDLVDRAHAAAPDANIEGVLVCEQITGGVECVIGVSQDVLFGPTVMLGIGGVTVELYRDVTFRVPPFDRAECRRMIDELRASKLLAGYRGAPPGDVKALVDTVMRVQRLAVDHAATLRELDINPIVVLPDGVVALDALVVMK